MSTLLPLAQSQLSQHSLLVLQNCYEEAEEGPGPLGARSPLPATLQNPDDAPFLCRIYVHAHETLDPAEFKSLFSPVLEDLVSYMSYIVTADVQGSAKMRGLGCVNSLLGSAWL